MMTQCWILNFQLEKYQRKLFLLLFASQSLVLKNLYEIRLKLFPDEEGQDWGWKKTTAEAEAEILCISQVRDSILITSCELLTYFWKVYTTS